MKIVTDDDGSIHLSELGPDGFLLGTDQGSLWIYEGSAGVDIELDGNLVWSSGMEEEEPSVLPNTISGQETQSEGAIDELRQRLELLEGQADSTGDELIEKIDELEAKTTRTVRKLLARIEVIEKELSL